MKKDTSKLSKVRVKKQYGTWYYEKEYDWDDPTPWWVLYDANGDYVMGFPYYSDMVDYCETGECYR